MKKLLDILEFSEGYLTKNNYKKPKLEAQKIIAYVLKCERVSLYTNFEMQLEESELEKIRSILKEIVGGNLSFDEWLEEIDSEENLLTKEQTIRQKNLAIYSKAINYLKKLAVENAKYEVEQIFAKVLKVKPLLVTLSFEREITETELEEIRNYLKSRGEEKKPLAYLFHEEYFYGRSFYVDERVLIPRAETEMLVEAALTKLPKEESYILDVGTGSGAIALTIAKERPDSKVLGIDFSSAALVVANKNKLLLEAINTKFKESNLFDRVEYKAFDLIISNPPYIPLKEYETLMPEVKNYEPKMALTDGSDGYSLYLKIIAKGKEYLKSRGYLAIECGYNQAPKLFEEFTKNNYINIEIIRDLQGIERIIIAQKP